VHGFDRYRVLAAIVAATTAFVVFGSTACSPTQPTNNPTTETFTGTVLVGGADSKSFSVSQRGNVYITLTNLDPLTTAPLGIAIGTPASDGSCTVSGATGTIQVGQQTGTIEPPGNYCVGLFDVGYLLVNENYTLTVTHY
jgi:hypothetical protein